MATRIVFEIFSADFMPFRAFVKLLWQFVAKILGDVAENVYLRSRNQQKEKDYVVLFLGEAAAEEVSGQAAVDAGRYISPFTARRRYDEEGVMHYDEVERRLHPTGVEVMDHYLRRLTEGKDEVKSFCKRVYEDDDHFIFFKPFCNLYYSVYADALLWYQQGKIDYYTFCQEFQELSS